MEDVFALQRGFVRVTGRSVSCERLYRMAANGVISWDLATEGILSELDISLLELFQMNVEYTHAN